MSTTNCKRGSQNRQPHRNHLLTALFVAVMVMLLTLPAFAAETAVSESTPDWLENPADENGTFIDEVGATEPTLGPVSTLEELLDAIANANANDVIEFDASIQAYSGSNLVLGRADCPVTLRRTTSEARLSLGSLEVEDVIVQNITFDGAGVQSYSPILFVSSPSQFITDCNFINCIGGAALEIDYNCDTNIQLCNFANNTGTSGSHIRLGCRSAHIWGCTFTDGFASDRGPVYMRTQGRTELSGCTISGNAAGTMGGGIYLEGGELYISGCKIYGNTANGVADDITKDYTSLLSLADNYAALVELYKPDGVVPNRWTVDSHYDNNLGTDYMRADMIFSMSFADNEPSPPPSPASITLDQSELTLYVGEADTLTATLYPEGTNSSIQWTSSDPSVASVTESGLIIAHSAGTTSIIATATVGGASASCLVTVQEVPATTYSISISVSPTEGGTVSGSGQYEEGATATVTAVANEGFRFLEWAEAGTQISTAANLTFTVTSDRTLTAIFEPISEPAPGPTPKHTYTINVSAAEGGTASGGGEYEQGSSVTLTATPENGYRFIAWTESNEQISSDESYTFIADRDRTIIAYFVPTCTISIGATVGGTISTGTTAEGTSGGFGGEFLKGSSMTCTAIPDSGYLFAGWTENGEQVSVDESITIIVERDLSLVANFKPISKPTYTINVSTTEGGTVSGEGEYEQGSSVTLTAIPANGYRFIAWTENDEQISTDENFKFIADHDRTLVAIFMPISKPTYTVHVSSAQGGTVEGSGSYKEGETVTVNAVPDNGYRFRRWEENSVQVSTEARYSFAAETDRMLVAVFELIPQSGQDSTYVPGTPSTSYRPNGGNTQPTTTSLPSRTEVQAPTLTNGKITLLAPDNLFWGGYKTGRDNGAGTVTRADLAQLVYFMMDTESVKIHGVTQSPFRDVESGAWYEAAVGTLQNAGIMVGCGDDLFCPDRTLTWGELLTVFARFTEDEPLTEYYTGEHWAKDSVNKAFTLGWLEYTEVFDPGRIVTTGEMVDLIQEVFRWNNE